MHHHILYCFHFVVSVSPRYHTSYRFLRCLRSIEYCSCLDRGTGLSVRIIIMHFTLTVTLRVDYSNIMMSSTFPFPLSLTSWLSETKEYKICRIRHIFLMTTHNFISFTNCRIRSEHLV